MTTTLSKADSISLIRANFPAELQELDQWVCWKYELKRGAKKPTKVLYNPATGARADSTKPATWATFGNTCTAYLQGAYDGIGFVVTKHDPYVGIDLDGCIVDGQFTDDALRWVELLDSYTEISPSLSGVRVWVKGKKPGERCKEPSKGVEIYEAERFFTATGRRLDALPVSILERQIELDALYNELFPAKEEIVPTANQAPPAEAVLSIDDQDLIRLMCRKPDIQALWDGSLAGHNDDHSSADQALCNHLAFYTGRDADRMNRLFKQSKLYRPKWDRADYSKRTIDKAIAGTATTYDPNYRSNGQSKMGRDKSTFSTNGHAHPNGATPAPEPVTDAQEATPEPAAEKGQPTSSTAVLLQTLEDAGYVFRMNELDDSIEVNGKIISDGVASEVRCFMRDKGFRGMEAVKDAYTMRAYHNRYHPIRDFLDGLTWDGRDHIAHLAAHFTGPDARIAYADGEQKTVFHAFLQRFLVGAVAKVYERGQNITLTLAGPQGIGKSYVAAWLCSPMRDYFNEGQLDPDGKETDRRLARTWIWEIGELGATTRRADVNALKNKLTQQEVTFRVPYGHYDVTKPVLTSFIGTVNPDGRGFLVDKTGNRRFAVVNITSIDHSYSAAMDAQQVWAQAVALYRAGEPWRLTVEETTTQSEINAGHQSDETIDMIMPQLFCFDLSNDSLQMSPMSIAQELLMRNYAKDLDKCAKDAAAWLKANGHTKKGKPLTWRGIRLRLPNDSW